MLALPHDWPWLAEAVSVVAPIDYEDLAFAERADADHVLGVLAIVGLPSVSLSTTGKPLASTSAWSLVVSPLASAPRSGGLERRPERQAFRADPLFDVAAMLMNPNRRRVDHCRSPP